MSYIVRLALVFIVLLFGLAFHLKNNQTIILDYYISTIELPFSLIMVLVLCVGALLGLLASLPIIIKLKQQKHRLEKQNKKSEEEINNLRVIPIRD